MTLSNSPARRFLRVLLWIFGIIFGLLLLVIVALNLPPVQKWLTGKVESVLQDRLNTDVGIGRIALNLPTAFALREVYINTPEGDTLLRLDQLAVDINMWRLLRREVVIQNIALANVYGNIIVTDTTSNIDFLLDALVPTDTAAQLPPDTTSTDPAPTWNILFPYTGLELSNVDVYYQDDPTGILVDLEIGAFNGETKEIDLTTNRYLIEELQLADSRIRVNIGEAPPDTTETPVLDYFLTCNKLQISNTHYRMGMDSLDLVTYIRDTELNQAELALGETIRFTAPSFTLEDGSFRMDLPAPEVQRGIDYNHLALSGIQIDLDDIRYVGDSLSARINQLQASERSGLVLSEAQGSVLYTPSFVGLENFRLRTPRTEISSPNSRIDYDFTNQAPLEELRADVNLEGHIGIGDVLLLAPEMAQYPVLRNNANQAIHFDARASGNGQAMSISRLNINGPGLVMNSSGTVRYPFDPDRIEGILNLPQLTVQPPAILPLVPPGMLPPGIDWPQRLIAEGRFQYANNRLQLRLYALEQRPGSPLLSRVRTNGSVSGVQSYPNTRLDITLDTVLVTRRTLLAYLPPSAIPPEYRLPDFVRGSGTLEGPINNLNIDLRLDLPSGQTFVAARGTVANLTQPDSLRLDLELSDLALAAADVSAFLPDTLIPDYLNLPDLRIEGARIRGGLENLTFELPIATSNGQWNLAGRYNPNDLDIQADLRGIDLVELFRGPMRDSMATLDLNTLNIRADVTGQLQPGMDLAVNAVVEEQDRGQILALTGTAAGQVYQGQFTLSHPDLTGSGQAFYNAEDTSAIIVDADLEIERMDLQRWNLSEGPLYLSGSLAANSRGLQLDNMVANLELDDITLRSDTASAYIDSLVATAELLNGENDIQVRSDLLDLSITGNFVPDKVVEEFDLFLRDYWSRRAPNIDPVIYGNRVDVSLQVKNPRPLTSGIIPGLRELSPLQLKAIYRDQSPELLVDLTLPRLNYAGLQMDSLVLNATGDTALLAYRADWADVNMNNSIRLGRTRFDGQSEDNALRVNLTVWNENDSVRHQISALADPETDSLMVRMAPEQILNFETWNVPPSNLIVMVGDRLVIRDWALESGDQRLAMETTTPGDVQVEFVNFELATLSRLINSEEDLISGQVNGPVALNDVLSQMTFQSDLTVDSLRVMTSPLGRLTVDVASRANNVFVVDVDLEGEGNDLSVDGAYTQNGSLDLRLLVDALQMQSLEGLSAGFLQETEGQLTGQVAIGGTLEAPTFDGNLRFDDATIGVSMLGTRFRFSEEPIVFNDRNIVFNNLTLYDTENNEATLNGRIIMRSVADYGFDMTIRADDFLAINSTVEDNELYYGRLALDAVVEISGDILEPVVEVTATPLEGSNLVYRYSVSALKSTQTGEGVIVFLERQEWDDPDLGEEGRAAPNGFMLTANLNINPGLTFTLVLDPITGDAFTGSGNGDLSFTQYPDGRMDMVGQVEMVSGTYDFTYQGLIEREFRVQPGSTILWTGDVTNPNVDLTVVYSVDASPFPLVSNYVSSDLPRGLRRDQRFDVLIEMQGNLLETSLSTNITYPDVFGNTGAEPIDEALVALRADESQLNQQAFGLLLFQGFINQGGTPDDQVGLVNNTVNTTLDNVLTQQLNNLANRFLGFVEVDFGVESYQNAAGGTSRDLRLSLRKTLLNDRLIVSVDGVASSAEDQEDIGPGQSYLDNITAEYLLNENGNLRLKVFNDRDRTQFALGEVVRVGGRLVFSKDFETIRFFGRKEEEPTIRREVPRASGEQ